MLPAEARVRRSADFAEIRRDGRRASAGGITVTVLVGSVGAVPRVGFVVPRGVGGAVIRNRLRRRLRHLLAARLDGLPPGCSVTVSASARAVGLAGPALGLAVDRALVAALARVAR